MNYTEVIVAFIGLCSAILTAVVVPLLKAKLEGTKTQKNVELVYQYVKAVEQLIGAGNGEQKKEKVIELLMSKGVKVDENIETIIEAAVYSLTNVVDQIASPTPITKE